jgi:hypothetical protein
MTVYTQSKSVSVGGQTLTVMIRPGVDGMIADAAGAVLQRARKCLESASGAVCQGSEPSAVAHELARTYFAAGQALTDGDWNTIRTVITKTRTGLEGDVVIKTGTVLSGAQPQHQGAVHNRVVSQSDFDGQVPSRPGKSYQTFVGSMKPEHAGIPIRRGAIHLRSDLLSSDPELGIVALIHEATHKYAGTWDYAYFDEETGSRSSPPITDKASALGNADSYAWFVMFLHVRGARG